MIRSTIHKILFDLPLSIRLSLVNTLALYSRVRLNRQNSSSYSQFGEDLMLISHLKAVSFNKINSGKYLDIGCFHSSFLSNTYLLHKLGWEGVGIDIGEAKCAEFERARLGKAKAICGAISPEKSRDQTVEGFFF
jgi:hypothetical protein